MSVEEKVALVKEKISFDLELITIKLEAFQGLLTLSSQQSMTAEESEMFEELYKSLMR
jgi:hypothetical protein